MKKLIYLAVLIGFYSCHEYKSKEIQNQLNGIEVNKQSKISNFGKPPGDNPIMKELLHFDKPDLNRIHQLYIKTINEAKDQEYLDNLKQYGFLVLVTHGLINNGTTEQKKYYIKEQLSSQANFPSIINFYNLIRSDNLNLSVTELEKIEKQFYTKNFNLINSLNWIDLNAKKDKLRELNNKHILFSHFLSSMENE